MREKIMSAIREHVAAEYPNEACGVIVQSGQSQEYIPCRNISETPKEHFTLSPDDFAEAENKGEVLMIIHSHPDVVQLIPSELDRIQCDHSGVEWGIMSWPEGDFCTISPRGDRELAGRRWVLGHADCWTLVRDYFRQERSVILNNWSVDYEWWVDGKENRYDDNWQAEGFTEVDVTDMKPGDVIMMRVQAPVTNHAAVYLGNNIMLHHAFGNLSARVPYGKYYRDRTVRIVRHKELLGA
ncbi:Phage tail assembly protein [Pantoea sp. AS-PWVM4]|uniref:C40 family peptidase n=1 Tax=Pantoea sp. AS-PWVM4 TaxID=1332069 RepID=UPI0003AC980A|nr:C40 family peptidase [Pantoea sp. AS-PWVM4]ERK18622.1 Phage tail assembly protein [Pantoea sp. AS-PWVM4]